jgi:thymidylate synthase (FAD)
MKVTIIGATKNATRLCAAAAWTCTHEETRLPEDFTIQEAGEMVQRVAGYGHESILEHATFSVRVEGVSRSLTHQLVRHRIASYSQQSQRYVRLTKGDWFVVPPKIAGDDMLLAMFKDSRRSDFNEYEAYINAGVKEEDARECLPNCCKTSIDITMNGREWRHYLGERLCANTQWQHRDMAGAILNELKHVALPIFENVGPKCDAVGFCIDGRTCGRHPRRAK